MTALALVLRYARAGRCVFPLVPNGKEPMTSHGVYDATSDEGAIRAWGECHATCNWGMALEAGEIVIDVDVRNGGPTSLEQLEREHGPLPPTRTQVTPTDGRHLLFAVDPQTRTRGKLAAGIDLLRAGRYIVVAPSMRDGRAYRWTSGPTPIAPLPAWVLARARAIETAPTPVTESAPWRSDVFDRARRYLAQCAPAISGSGGHVTTFLIAQKLVRGFALDHASALTLMLEWNQTCQPPWTVRDLERKVKEAARAGSMPVGALRDAERRTA